MLYDTYSLTIIYMFKFNQRNAKKTDAREVKSKQ